MLNNEENGFFFRRVENKKTRAIRPGDIAILVRVHRQAEMISAVLKKAGIPSILSEYRQCFDSPEATKCGYISPR